MINKKQLTIQEEAGRKIRQSQKECKHSFGPAIPAFSWTEDEVLWFAVCSKCGYKTD